MDSITTGGKRMRFECEYCGETSAEIEEAKIFEAGISYDHFAIRCHSPECGVVEPCEGEDIQNLIVTLVNKRLSNGKLDYHGSLKEALKIVWRELYMKDVKE
jgi:hypothetical protein